MRPIALLAALSLVLPMPVAAQATMPSQLTDAHRADLHCAAAFALAASAQMQGDAAALALPPLGVRGKRFFALVGDRVVEQAGLTREQVRDLLTAEVVAIQHKGAAEPDKELAAQVRPCIARLDADVPPLKAPDLLQCSAIMAIAYEEIHAREGMTASAKDLKTLASVLSAREHEALVASGKSEDAADATIALAHDAMLKEAFDGAGGVEKYDIAHCYDLAKPNEKSHY